MADLDWWGRGTAHHIPDLKTMRSACGHYFTTVKTLTRLDTETGLPWPRCTRCIKALSGQQPPAGTTKEAKT